MTLQPTGSGTRKNSDLSQLDAESPEFLRIPLRINAAASRLKCYVFRFSEDQGKYYGVGRKSVRARDAEMERVLLAKIVHPRVHKTGLAPSQVVCRSGITDRDSVPVPFCERCQAVVRR